MRRGYFLTGLKLVHFFLNAIYDIRLIYVIAIGNVFLRPLVGNGGNLICISADPFLVSSMKNVTVAVFFLCFITFFGI